MVRNGRVLSAGALSAAPLDLLIEGGRIREMREDPPIICASCGPQIFDRRRSDRPNASGIRDGMIGG